MASSRSRLAFRRGDWDLGGAGRNGSDSCGATKSKTEEGAKWLSLFLYMGLPKWTQLGLDCRIDYQPTKSKSSRRRSMATTAAAYGCSAAPAFPPIPSHRRAPPSRVCLASSSSPRARAPPTGLTVSYRRRRPYVSACSGKVDSDAVGSPAEATFDIKLPRRSLLVQFTCKKCNERTKRLINRVAYERGTVFLQCAGCKVYHKFVDNLGLIVEYDLREENDTNTCTED